MKYSDIRAMTIPNRNGILQLILHNIPPRKGMITADRWLMVNPTAIEDPMSLGSAIF